MQGANGSNVLHLACSDSDSNAALKKAKILIAHDATLLVQPNAKGNFPIHSAVIANNSELVSYIIQQSVLNGSRLCKNSVSEIRSATLRA